MSLSRFDRMTIPIRLSPLCLTVVAFVAITSLTGCHPKYYRIQADNEVRELVHQDVVDAESPLNDLNVYGNPTSRMFDPNPPDFEPMPPDDPRSHELMHSVDGKKGYKHWDKNGHTPHTENPEWAMYLCPAEDGTIPIDIRGAVALSLNNSRVYQERLEQLYLSALTVSFERFRFDAQFFAGHETFFTSDGPARSGGAASELDLATRSMRMTKLYASGGELVVGFANRMMWQFSGDDTHTATTLLDFSLVQPLLKSRGRLQVLESLTDTERDLLAEVRQMERFRRGFYADIVSGLDPNSITGGGVGIGASSAGGFLGLLQDTQEIRNQQASVAGLRDSLDQLEAAYEASRIDRFQVELARQALYAAQSRLISQKAGYQGRLDSYKIELGLPPESPIVLNDPYLDQFNFLDPAMLELQDDVGEVLDVLRSWNTVYSEMRPLPVDVWNSYTVAVGAFVKRAADHVRIVEQDMVALEEALPERRQNLQRLTARIGDRNADIDANAYSPEVLEARVTRLKEEKERFDRRAELLLEELGRIRDPAKFRDLTALLVKLSDELQELMLIQAGARLDTVTLQPIEINSYEALHVARCNRRDWQNERAFLTDAWRQIQFASADLTSFFNVIVEGDISNTGDNPIRLRGTTGRLRVGAEFDAPLTRLAERNRYRTAQIAYQEARRDYYEYEDIVSLGLRNSLRNADLRQVDFELRRAAVQVAISQVELTQLRLSEPPKVGAKSTFSSNTARDLVTAIGSLLDAQNDFLGVWLNYEVLRMGLDFNLGTMEIDNQGIWIDPGVISLENLPPCENCIPEAPRAFDEPQYAIPARVAGDGEYDERVDDLDGDLNGEPDGESIGPGDVLPVSPEAPQDEALPDPDAKSIIQLPPLPAATVSDNDDTANSDDNALPSAEAWKPSSPLESTEGQAVGSRESKAQDADRQDALSSVRVPSVSLPQRPIAMPETSGNSLRIRQVNATEAVAPRKDSGNPNAIQRTTYLTPSIRDVPAATDRQTGAPNGLYPRPQGRGYNRAWSASSLQRNSFQRGSLQRDSSTESFNGGRLLPRETPALPASLTP